MKRTDEESGILDGAHLGTGGRTQKPSIILARHPNFYAGRSAVEIALGRLAQATAPHASLECEPIGILGESLLDLDPADPSLPPWGLTEGR